MSAPSQYGTASEVTQAISWFHGVRYIVTDVKRAIEIQVEDPDGNPVELFEPARQK